MAAAKRKPKLLVARQTVTVKLGERPTRDAADGRDIRLGGGVSTIRQYLRAALIDELHLAIAPVLLGTGEHLLNGIDVRALGYECVEHVAGARAAAHAILRKRK